MTELHERRASGKYRKAVRGKDPHVANKHGDSTDAWPAFWNQECEDAFEKLKKLSADAVDLSVPDLDGAANGTNPYLLFPDACKYGIGAGLFQASPSCPKLRASHYATLGLPVWSTKAAIESRYQELRRLYTGASRNAVKLEQIQYAYEVLHDVESRKKYDSDLGLQSGLNTRVDIRPLGFFSKSLSKEQMNWATWDRELFAIVQA